MDIKQAISAVLDQQNLSEDAMQLVMHQIMSGEATEAQIGGFLIGLRAKGETVDEIVGAAKVMRALSTPVDIHDDEHLVDTCGTGGDGASLFNVSTGGALVVAAAGGKVAKHGNRSNSSKSGSADVLEAAGVSLSLGSEQVAQCIDKIGVGFMFAPNHHSAMKYAVKPRKEMGVRTIFNVLGPLTNPAGAKRQVIGVFSKAWLKPLAQALLRLGSEHVMLVHSDDGLDEISICADTAVVELHNGEINEYIISPEKLGLKRYNDLSELVVDSPASSLNLIQQAFDNQSGAAMDMLAINSGAALYVAGIALDLKAGVVMAQDVMATGQAKEKLNDLIAFTQCC